jgi:hypothetical protein
MDGRAFLEVAERLALRSTEEDWRTATGRAYYGLMQECRAALERWGFPSPRRDQLHAFVRLHFTYPADRDLRQIGDALELLGQSRNRADYQLAHPGPFADRRNVKRFIQEARDNLALLDAIEADPARRTAAIAAVRAAFP